MHAAAALSLILVPSGVNEKQTVANTLGTVGVQTEVNRSGLERMQSYFSELQLQLPQMVPEVCRPHRLPIHARVFLTSGLSFQGLETDMTRLAGLVGDQESDGGKNVEMLLASCRCARTLKAARTVSCKSAKDRTSMFQTLEAVRVIERAGLSPGCVLRCTRDPSGWLTD